MKRLALLLACLLCLGLAGCEEETPQATEQQVSSQETTSPEENMLVLLYTNDIKTAYLRDDNEGRLGYAAVAAYRNILEDAGKTVVLLDGGDALAGETAGLSGHMTDLMNETGYHYAVPGEQDLALGVDALLSMERDFSYVCCNLLTEDTGETVFPAYGLEEYGGVLAAYVGITNPKAQVAAGYRLETDPDALYDRVQDAIDEAKLAGADYVIALGHTGIDPEDAPYTTVQIIANTNGLTVYLDGHSNSWVEGETVRDRDDKKVPVFANPEGLTTLACITVDLNTGEVSGELVNAVDGDAKSVLDAAETVTDALEDQKTEATQPQTE